MKVDDAGVPTIGEQLEAARGERSHAQLAVGAGIARQRVTEAAGGHNVTLATLQRLADALGAPLVVHPGAALPLQGGQRQAAHRRRRQKRRGRGT